MVLTKQTELILLFMDHDDLSGAARIYLDLGEHKETTIFGLLAKEKLS